ncbi:MAG: hypothetical protein Q8M07_06025, partial [Prosthecobacter sp.]|nr:hypothetical protein [Prosthecobacter sp.]
LMAPGLPKIERRPMKAQSSHARNLFPNAIREGPEMAIAPTAETFNTIDNGGRPFKIVIDEVAGGEGSSPGVTLTVRVFASSVEQDERDKDVYPQLVGTWRNIAPCDVLRGRHRDKYQAPHKFARGPDDAPALPGMAEGDATCVLFCIDPVARRYVFVGVGILEFSLPEPALALYGMIGNSAVVYPVGRTASFAFLPEDCKLVPLSALKSAPDGENDDEAVWFDLWGEVHHADNKAAFDMEVNLICARRLDCFDFPPAAKSRKRLPPH